MAICISQANHVCVLAPSDPHHCLQGSTGRILPRDRLPAVLPHNLKALMHLHLPGCPTQFGGLLAYIKSMLTHWAAVRVLQGLVGLPRLCLSTPCYLKCCTVSLTLKPQLCVASVCIIFGQRHHQPQCTIELCIHIYF